MEELSEKINKYFPGKVVRKDLTKKIKEGANVPVYVLEYLLGMYCATDDENAIEDDVKKYDKLLVGGIWCILKIKYEYEENKRMPFAIDSLTPIQLSNMDLQGLFDGRKHFSKEEWIDVIIRSIGIEPTHLKEEELFKVQEV